MIVPGGTAQSGPDLVLLVSTEIKHPVAGRRQQPLVRAREIGGASHVLKVNGNLAERLSAVNDRQAAVRPGKFGKALYRHHHSRGRYHVGKGQDASARSYGFFEEFN